MSYDLESELSSLKKRIEAERSLGAGQIIFSEKLKADVCNAARRATSRTACAKALSLTPSLVFKWCDLEASPSPAPPFPRRLPVVENSEAPKLRFEDEGGGVCVDVCLPNGVRLKGVPFSRQSLALLGGLT